jgi:hypothetical protein
MAIPQGDWQIDGPLPRNFHSTLPGESQQESLVTAQDHLGQG